jgi:hypothetical protein
VKNAAAEGVLADCEIGMSGSCGTRASTESLSNRLLTPSPASAFSFGSLICRVYVLVPLHPLAAVAVTVKLNVPNTVGVPVNLPMGESVRAAGRVPEVIANVNDCFPPLAADFAVIVLS